MINLNKEIKMITFNFERKGLPDKLFIVKVSYGDKVAIDKLLSCKLSLIEVASILRNYVKDNYKLSIEPCEGKKFPCGYYESFCLDSIVSLCSRLRFVEVKHIEIPKVVYINKTIETEI